MKDRLLTSREASHFLRIPEQKVIKLAKEGVIPHLKLGGEFLRFRQEEIVKLKDEIKRTYDISPTTSHRGERIREFFYFNDFYLVATLIIIVLLWMIVKDFYS